MAVAAQDMEMMAAVMHEVKNPLALVRANIDLIELDDTESEHRKRYDAMRRELNKANDILAEFISFLSAPRREDRECYLRAIIAEQAARYDCVYPVGKVFKIRDETGGCPISGDQAQIGLVISNILKNALEACGPGPSIHIRIYRDGGGVCAEFKDNGRGLNGGKADKPYSNGIGLSICRRIMADHRGRFEIKNADGGGCVVRIYFPPYEGTAPGKG